MQGPNTSDNEAAEVTLKSDDNGGDTEPSSDQLDSDGCMKKVRKNGIINKLNNPLPIRITGGDGGRSKV